MSKVFLSPEAAGDLAQIKQYITLELKNPAAAGRIVAAILKELRAEASQGDEDAKIILTMIK